MKITMAKFLALEDELAQQKQLLKEVQNDLNAALDKGDLSENEEFSAARNKFEMTQNRITELEAMYSEAEIIPNDNGPQIKIGNIVEVTRVSKDGEPLDSPRRFEVATSGDTITGGILSTASPLGKEILNCPSGIFFVQNNGGTYFSVKKIISA